MKHILKIIAIGTLLALLAGCAQDNTPKPTPLAKVAPSVIQVKELWNASPNDGTDGEYFNLGPVLANGVIYSVSADGTVSAVDATTGRRLWNTSTALQLSTTPSVSGGRVYVGTLDGHLAAFSTANGKQLWTATLSSSALAAPAESQGIVVVHTHDGNVTAFDASTGAQKWVYNGQPPMVSLEGDAPPVISGDKVVVGFANGQVAVLSLTTGKVIWQRPIALPEGSNVVANLIDVDSKPIVLNGTIYAVAYHGNLVALDLDTGRLLWQTPLSAYRALAYANGFIIAVDDQGDVKAFDINTGKEAWMQDAFAHRFVSAPAVIGNDVVVGDYAGYVHWISLSDGALLARTKIGDTGVRAQPVVQSNTVYFTTNGGEVVALQPLH